MTASLLYPFGQQQFVGGKTLLHCVFRGLPHGGLTAEQPNRQNIKFMMMNYFRVREEVKIHVFRYNSGVGNQPFKE